MPATFDLQNWPLDDFGSAIALAGGQFGEAAEDIDLGQNSACLDQPGGLGRHAIAQSDEQLVFEGVGAVLGVPDLVLVFLQLGRDVALGVLDRLLADVVAGDLRAPLPLWAWVTSM